jgi:hypothetical protein
MSKTIYTEHDVEDLARRGVKEIAITDEVYLTDSARERAVELGIALLATAAAPATARTDELPAVPRENAEQVVRQVQAAVVAKLGPSVDAAVVERIVRRVVGQMK